MYIENKSGFSINRYIIMFMYSVVLPNAILYIVFFYLSVIKLKITSILLRYVTTNTTLPSEFLLNTYALLPIIKIRCNI